MVQISLALGVISKCLAHPKLKIAFTVKDTTAVNEVLLREATINARKKAELLCDAANVKLGKLMTIDYNWAELDIYSNSKINYCQEQEYSFMKEDINIEPDDIDVSDTATFVWEIE